MTYTILWDTLKAVLIGKFIALSAYIKKVEKSHTSILTAHLKDLEQKKKGSHPGGVDTRKLSI